MTNHNVSLNGLRIFEAASRHLNFTSTALELHVSQAAVSQQIRNLEEQIGSKLFVRGGRTLSLTVAGEKLATATRSALHTINDALDNITSATSTNAITISTLPSFASRWLIPRLDNFQNAHPDIELHIHTSGSKVNLLGGKIDAAIRLAAVDEADLITKTLLPDALCLIATPELATKIGSDKNNLYKYPLAADSIQLFDTQQMDYTASAVDSSFEALGIDDSKLKIRRFTSSDNTVQSALAGKTTAITRLSLCVDDLSAGRLNLLFSHCKPLEQGTSFVYPQSRENDIELMLFRDWLCAEATMSSQKLKQYLPT